MRVPTLVLHGTVDPLIRPAGGRATARAIPGAKLRLIEGMGHDMPPGAHSIIADAIAAHAGVRPVAAQPVAAKLSGSRTA